MSKQQMTDKLRKFCVALTGGRGRGGSSGGGCSWCGAEVEWNPVLQEVDDLKFILHVWFIHAFKPAYKVFMLVKQMPIETLVEKRRDGGLHLGVS